MADGTILTIKRPITVRAVVTPTWKEEAEREISNGIANCDQQLAQLEQEGQQVVDEVRRQSANPLDPRVQEQVAQIQQQVAAKRAEIEEQSAVCCSSRLRCASSSWSRSWSRASWRAPVSSPSATTWCRRCRCRSSSGMVWCRPSKRPDQQSSADS